MSAALLLFSVCGCGTDAVAADACREIESARCEQAIHCGDRFDVEDTEDVENCKRFYNTQCLHGFAADDAPGTPQVNACVATLRAAGDCAKNDGEDATCSDLEADLSEPSSACDVVAHPERASTCSFLNPAPPTIEDDEAPESAGGSGGTESTTESSAAGESGSGGAAAETD